MKHINRAAPITLSGYKKRREPWASFARCTIVGAILTAVLVHLVTK